VPVRGPIIALVAAAAFCGASPGRADPLNKVTGTEDWSRAGPEDLAAEWEDWYRARAMWRRASREQRLQRGISARLAALLRGDRPPAAAEIKRIIRAGTADLGSPARRAIPSAKPRTIPRPALQPWRSPVEEAPPGEGDAFDPPEGDAGSRSSDWSQVPVEKLDRDGQIIDEEGDRELRRSRPKKGH
jgi:hypothetical protein